MSRNGSGTYTLPAGNPVVTGTTISTTWANNTLNDIAATLTDSVAADGQTPMTGDLDLNSNKIVNLAPATFAGDAVEYAQLVSASSTSVAITGGTINGATVGATTPASGRFTTLEATGAFTAGSTAAITGNTTVGGTLAVTGISTFTGNGSFNGTGALKIPAGTTGQQPTPTTGMIRYDTTLNEFQGYYASTWGAIGGVAAGSNTQVQYNNGGVLAGSSALTFNGTTLATTTLSSTNLSDGTNSTSTTNAISGSAKAWVNFNGGTATPSTIRASFNVSSVTRNSTGNYTVNFTNALADANYCVVGGACTNLGGGTVLGLEGGGIYSTTAVQFFTANNDSSTAGNPTITNIAVFR
jgi:hypothetical protein